MRGIRSYVVTGGYTLVVMMFVLIAYWLAASVEGGPLNRKAAEAGRAIWTWGCIAQAVLLPLMVPAFTCGAITVERERDLLELLLLTRQSALRICLGKLFSGVGFGLTLMLASIPVLALSLFLGGLAPGEIVASLCVLCTTVLATGALGLVASATLPRTVTATVFCYLIVGAVLIGAPAVFGLLLGARSLNGETPGEWSVLAMLLGYVVVAFPPALGGAFLLSMARRHRTGKVPVRAWWLGTTGLLWGAVLLSLYLPGVSDVLLQGKILLALHPVVAIWGLMDHNAGTVFPLASSVWGLCSVAYLGFAIYSFSIAVIRVRRMRAV